MMNRRHMLRTTVSAALALMLAAAPGCAAAETEVPQDLGSLIESSGEAVEAAMEQAEESHEGYLYVTVEDPMRAAISEYAGNTDDMSWVRNAELLLQQVPNESGGSDAELTLFFNDTELYHLQISFDDEEKVLYAVCPELLDKAMALPFGQSADGSIESVTSKIPPEILEEIGTLMVEFGQLAETIPPEMIQQSIMNYVGTLAGYITAEQGIASVTAGTLTAETSTTTYKVSAEDMKVMLPQLLQLLSEDELLAQAMKSDLVNHLISLAMQQSGSGIQLTGEEIYAMLQPQIASLAQSDFSGVFGFNLTLGTDNQGSPASIALAMETSGVTAELFRIDKVVNGTDHAIELKLGPVLASAIGLDTSTVSGVVIQGSADQGMLNETVSLNVNGASMPVLQVSDLDLVQLQSGKLSGSVTFAMGGKTVSCDLYEAEDGAEVKDVYINEDLWCTITADMYTAEDIEIDAIDTSDAFEVTDQESLAAYMRDAKVTKMLEKLADAGVPQEYVDKLTSGEASTESSRENVEETDAAS